MTIRPAEVHAPSKAELLEAAEFSRLPAVLAQIRAEIPYHPQVTDEASLFLLGTMLLSQRPKLVVEAGTCLGHFALLAGLLLPDSWIYTTDTNMDTLKSMRPTFPNNVVALSHDFGDMLEIHTLMEIDFAYLDSGRLGVCITDTEGNVVEESGDAYDTTDIRLLHNHKVRPRMRSGGWIVNHDVRADDADWTGGQEIAKEANLLLRGGRGLSVQVMA